MGIYYFYLKNYEMAIKKFNKSIDYIKNINTGKSKTGNSNDSELDETEEYYAGIDDFDFDNQTYNIFEF